MAYRTSPLLHAALPAPHRAPTARDGALARARRLGASLLRAPVGWTWLERHDVAGQGSDAAGDALVGDAAGAELGREVIARGAPLVVGDAERVASAPLRHALGVHGWRAFVAVPLLGPDGAALGALAVADVRPRAWREDEVTALAELASLATLAASAHGADRDWLSALAHREAQDARRKSEERLALVFHGTPDITFLVSADDPDEGFRFVAVNDAYLELTGLAAEQVLGRRAADVLAPDRLPAELARFRQVARAGEPLRYEERLELPLGPAVVEVTLTPIAGEAERCLYVLGVARDVTVRRRAEEELRAARDLAERARAAAEQAQAAAERANQAKTDFLSRMSHELRTPLNSVIGFANVLRANRGHQLDARELSYVDRIVTNGRHLLSLITDLLDISRIEAGKMPLVTGPVPLAPLVRSTLSGLEPQLQGRPVELRAELPATLQRLDTDATKLQQVILNLVGNALKFTPEGSVTVRVTADPDTGRPLRLEVEDTGVGIPLEQQEAVFHPFEQGEPGGQRALGGTGLGLTITRALCQLLGYRLTLRSAPGSGSLFTVHFTE